MLLCNETEVENLEFIINYSGVEYNLHTGAVAGTAQNQIASILVSPICSRPKRSSL